MNIIKISIFSCKSIFLQKCNDTAQHTVTHYQCQHHQYVTVFNDQFIFQTS